MHVSVPPTVAERFGFIMAWLGRAVVARRASPRELGPVIMAICNRLSRIAVRFAKLAGRVAAGTLPVTRRRVKRAAVSPPASVAAPPVRLPQGDAWLVRLVPEARVFGSQLRHLLTDPEMAAMLTAAPELGRLLRPLCRMLGVTPMPELLAVAGRSAAAVVADPAPLAHPVVVARPAVRPVLGDAVSAGPLVFPLMARAVLRG